MYPLFSRLLLLLAACLEYLEAGLDLNEVCHLTKPEFRMRVLQKVMDRIQDEYDIANGVAIFGTCDPTDPNMPPDCMNYNNPSVAYGSTLVPCPDGECPPETPSSFLPGKSGFYQPRQDHALVLFGCLPPETEYFGIRSYLYEKAISNVRKDLNCSNAMSSVTGESVDVFPPEPTVPDTRVVVDTPWFDTRNHLSIDVARKPDSQTKFRSLFTHITTANKEVAAVIANAFVKSGVPAEAMNIDSIPNVPIFHLEGNSSVRDSFRTIYRLVLPVSFVSSYDDSPPSSSEEEINKYISFNNMNILVRYLKPKVPVPRNGILPQRFTTRSVGKHEKEIIGEQTFPALLSAVRSFYGEPDYISNAIPIVVNVAKCLQGCYGFGDNEDTVYINTDKSISLAKADAFAVVCGANHILLEYAVYTSVGIFNTSGLAVGLVTDDMKQNSAVRFAPEMPHVDKFYCIEIRSDCGDDPFCAEPLFGTKTLLVQYRINLNPHTKTGPAVEELIWPVILGYEGNSG